VPLCTVAQPCRMLTIAKHAHLPMLCSKRQQAALEVGSNHPELLEAALTVTFEQLRQVRVSQIRSPLGLWDLRWIPRFPRSLS
jgi:hypothetical protein